jgi:1-acyl-sn-glycerol-3-phosphate acyltransferase
MRSALRGPLRNPHVRRAVTVPAVAACAGALAGTVGTWFPLAAGLDLLRGRGQVPTARALSLALGWSMLETVGVTASAALWAAGRSEDVDAHFGLQRWWADRVVDVLGRTAGLAFDVDGLEALEPGPLVLCARHASLVDALIPVWLLGRIGMRPRYVLKDDLQLDPCLDIVGRRLPNHFVDRDPGNSPEELAELERLSRGMGPRDASIIFPEGMVVTDHSRARALDRVAARDPERFQRLTGLRILAPVRPSGTAALLRGAPDADLVFVTHTGLESLQLLVDAPHAMPLEQPVRVRIVRVPRGEVPEGEVFPTWLDDQWSLRDRELVQPV